MSSARPTFSTRPPPRFFVVLITLLEVIAALGLVSGLYPRISSTIAAGILLAAVYAVARVHPLKWRWQQPGIEYMLFWAIICLCAGISTQHSAIDRSVGNLANLPPPSALSKAIRRLRSPAELMPLALLQNVAAASTMFLILASSKGASCAGCRPNPHEGASQSLSSPTTFAHAAARSRIFSTGSTP